MFFSAAGLSQLLETKFELDSIQVMLAMGTRSTFGAKLGPLVGIMYFFFWSVTLLKAAPGPLWGWSGKN